MKSLKQYVYEKMEKDGYVTDQEIFDFTKKETSLYTACEYKDQWRRLNRDRNFFADKKIIGKERMGNKRKRYAIQIEGGEYYACGKEYFNEV